MSLKIVDGLQEKNRLITEDKPMGRIRRCPKNCYVTDQYVVNCPRCGRKMSEAGPDTEENRKRIIEENEQQQRREHPDKMLR